MTESSGSHEATLHWIPLGAGGAAVVRVSGRLYEALVAFLGRRPRRQLYHAALVIATGAGTCSVEVAPTPDLDGARDRGVVAVGPVGLRPLGRFRLFRYEVRRWWGGTIPDLVHAVGPPVVVTREVGVVEALLEVLPAVPTPTWGRDELGLGEMWNSNSVVAWALASVGISGSAGAPPARGRAPGWDAGLAAVQRSAT